MEELTEIETLRHKKTPTTYAFQVIGELDSLISNLTEKDKGSFIEEYLVNLFDGKTIDGDLLVEQMHEEFRGIKEDEKLPHGLLYPPLIACAYAMQAILAYTSENSNERLAWTFVADAQYWLGIIKGDHAYRSELLTIKKKTVDKMGAKRHAEDRAIKADVFAFLEAHIDEYKKRDQLAEAITKQQPIKLSTAKTYISEFLKRRKTAS